MIRIDYTVSNGALPITVEVIGSGLPVNVHYSYESGYFNGLAEQNWTVEFTDADECVGSDLVVYPPPTTTTTTSTSTSTTTSTTTDPFASTTTSTTTIYVPDCDLDGTADELYCTQCFGLLYPYATIESAKGFAPAGWHVPTKTEYDTLITYLGGSSVAGQKLKNVCEENWNSILYNDNSSEFSAKGTGNKTTTFNLLQSEGWYLTSSKIGLNYYYMKLTSSNATATTSSFTPLATSSSLRLIKDNDNYEGSMTGNDGTSYSTIKIGNQVWMKEELRETEFADNTPMTEGTDFWVYNNDWDNACRTNPVIPSETLVISNTGEAGTFISAFYSTVANAIRHQGQSFTYTGTITKISLALLKATGNSNCNYEAYLYEGEMTGTGSGNVLIATSTNKISSSLFTNWQQFYDFNFNNVYIDGLVSVVIKPVDIVLMNDYNYDNYTVTLSNVIGGDWLLRTVFGEFGDWSANTNADSWIKIYALV